MEPGRTRQISCWLLLLCALAAVGRVRAQFNADTHPEESGQIRRIDPSVARGESPSVAQEMIERQLKRQREEHQRQIYSDTNRLLQLATDLKAQVDRSEKPTPGEIKDVDEIGKLAKRVSERIKTQ